jgi:signal peptidase II
MFPDQGNFFIVIAVVVALTILLYYRYLPTGEWLVRLSLGLQLGGALGNLLDRLRYGHVVDFVDIGFWPIFNVADVSIVSGVAILAYCLWREDRTAQELTLTPADEEGRS